MKVVCERDRLRFVDETAPDNEHWVHAVEVSDHRSPRHFCTCYVKQHRRAVDAKYPKHNREMFHGGESHMKWTEEVHPGKRWAAHFHISLDHPPTLEDLKEFRHEISDELWDELRTNL